MICFHEKICTAFIKVRCTSMCAKPSSSAIAPLSAVNEDAQSMCTKPLLILQWPDCLQQMKMYKHVCKLTSPLLILPIVSVSRNAESTSHIIIQYTNIGKLWKQNLLLLPCNRGEVNKNWCRRLSSELQSFSEPETLHPIITIVHKLVQEAPEDPLRKTFVDSCSLSSHDSLKQSRRKASSNLHLLNPIICSLLIPPSIRLHHA